MKQFLLCILILALLTPAIGAPVQPFTGKLYNKSFIVYSGSTPIFTVDYATGNVTITGTLSGLSVSLASLSDWPAAVSATEVGYLDGVTSSVQTQLNAKAPSTGIAQSAVTGLTAALDAKAALAGASFSGGVDVTAGGLGVTGLLEARDNVAVGGTLQVTGDTALTEVTAESTTTNSLLVLMGATFNNNVSVAPNATVDGVDVGSHTHSGAAGMGANIPESSVANLVTDLAAKAGKPAQVVTVGASGCDYTTVTAALASISDASASKRYTILVYPGTYYSGTHFDCKDYVSLVGVDRATCQITGGDVEGLDVLDCASHMELRNLTITNTATGAEAAAVSGVDIPSGVTDCHVTNCTINAHQWPVTCGGTDCSITYCTVNGCNPFWLSGLRTTVSHCNGYYSTSTVASSCVAAFDAAMATDSTITDNQFEIVYTPASDEDGVYIAAVSKPGTVIARNVVRLRYSGRTVGRAIRLGGAGTVDDGNTIYVADNTFLLECTDDAPLYMANVEFENDFPAASVVIQGNTIRLQSDVAPSENYWSLRPASYTDPTANLPRTPKSFTADRQSMDTGRGLLTISPCECRIEWLPSTDRVRDYIDDIIGMVTGATFWSTATGQSDIDFTSDTPVLMQSGGQFVTLSPARTILLSGTPTGTVRVHGWDWEGNYVYEDLVSTGGGAAGPKPFKTLWYYQVTATGSGTGTLDSMDVVGLTGDLLSNDSITGIGFTSTGGNRTQLQAYGSTPDVTNDTIDLSWLFTDGDDIDIHYRAK